MLFSILSDVVAVVLTGAYTNNVLSLCLIFQNIGEFTKVCTFQFYGVCSLYCANEDVVFKYTNHKAYPDELSVKKKKKKKIISFLDEHSKTLFKSNLIGERERIWCSHKQEQHGNFYFWLWKMRIDSNFQQWFVAVCRS